MSEVPVELKQLLRSRASDFRDRYNRRSDILSAATRFKVSKYNVPVRITRGEMLLFNSATRGLVVLNTDETAMYEELEAGDHNDLQSGALIDFAAALSADGFVLPESFDEKEAFRQTYMAERQNKHSMVLTLAPTMACNFACGYCFQGLNKDLSKIGAKVPDGIYEFVASHAEQLTSLTVCWYGGEPLMSTEAIYALSDRLITLCDKKGISYSASIVTNGYFLDVKTAQKLWSRRCTSAQITVDGAKESHDAARPLISGRGTYDVIMKNIANVLDETAFSINVRVNVSRENLGSCGQMLEHFVAENYAGRGRFSVYFAQVEASTAESGTAFEDGLSKAEYTRAVLNLGEQARAAGLAEIVEAPQGIMGLCIAARDLGYLVTANGDVHKCWETAHDPKKRIGTVFKPNELSNSVNAKLWDAWQPFDNPICASCKIAPMCGGMCAQRFIYNGVGDENTLPCPEWKWNTAEYLFSRAVSLGILEKDRWLDTEATAVAEQSGKRHTAETLRAAQQTVLDKINVDREIPIEREFLLHGDGRLHENGASLTLQKNGT